MKSKFLYNNPNWFLMIYVHVLSFSDYLIALHFACVIVI